MEKEQIGAHFLNGFSWKIYAALFLLCSFIAACISVNSGPKTETYGNAQLSGVPEPLLSGIFEAVTRLEVSAFSSAFVKGAEKRFYENLFREMESSYAGAPIILELKISEPDAIDEVEVGSLDAPSSSSGDDLKLELSPAALLQRVDFEWLSVKDATVRWKSLKESAGLSPTHFPIVGNLEFTKKAGSLVWSDRKNRILLARNPMAVLDPKKTKILILQVQVDGNLLKEAALARLQLKMAKSRSQKIAGRTYLLKNVFGPLANRKQ